MVPVVDRALFKIPLKNALTRSAQSPLRYNWFKKNLFPDNLCSPAKFYTFFRFTVGSFKLSRHFGFNLVNSYVESNNLKPTQWAVNLYLGIEKFYSYNLICREIEIWRHSCKPEKTWERYRVLPDYYSNPGVSSFWTSCSEAVTEHCELMCF